MSQAPQKQKNAAVDRLPPHAEESELAVLGCVLLDATYTLNECEERGVSGEWFYLLIARLVYEAAAGLHKAGKFVDMVTLAQHLNETQAPPGDQNWISYIGGLADRAVSAANVSAYLDVLEDRRLARNLVRVGTDMVAAVFEVEEGEKTDARALVEKAEREILRLGEESAQARERHIKEIILRLMPEFESYHRGHAQIRGLTNTGLEYLDKLLGGIGGRNGNYFVLSARPGIGKTSLATQVASYTALDYVWWDPVIVDDKPVIEKQEDGSERIKCDRRVGLPVGIFSLEMAEGPLVERMLFQRARSDMQRWRTGFATTEDMALLAKAAGNLTRAGIYIDDTGRCTVDGLKARARRMARQYGCKLFVIDYIQLMRSGSKRFRDDRVQELSEISAEIQNLGKELGVPIMVLAQMNRDFEKDPTRRPRLADLKDCGSIEQDADVVMFLYKPKMRDKEEEIFDEALVAMDKAAGKTKPDWSTHPHRINALVAKNRYGPDGVAELLFQRSSTTFLDYRGWLKDLGQAPLAAGESRREPDGEMPSNEEMGL